MLSSLEVKGKRILFFTKIVFTLFVINLILLINYIDLTESNRMAHSLSVIKTVFRDVKTGREYFNKYDIERLSWLKENDSSLFKQHSEARNFFFNVLDKYQKKISLDEKGGGRRPKRNVFKVMFATGFDDDISNVSPAEEDDDDDNPERTPLINIDEFSVNDAIDAFIKYSENIPVAFLISIDTSVIINKMDSLIIRYHYNYKTKGDVYGDDADYYSGEKKETKESSIDKQDVNNTNEVETYTVKDLRPYFFNNFNYIGIRLKNDTVSLSLFTNFYDPKSAVQDEDKPVILDFLAKSHFIACPSVLYFSDSANTDITELAKNKRIQSEIRKRYGYYKLSMIDDLATAALKKYEEPVSILGFGISRRWFPVMLMFFLLVIYSLLFITVKKAKTNREKIITKYESDDSWDMLINYKWLRFLLWVLSPLLLLAIILYSTLIEYSIIVYSAMILAGAACILLGFLAYKFSIKL